MACRPQMLVALVVAGIRDQCTSTTAEEASPHAWPGGSTPAIDATRLAMMETVCTHAIAARVRPHSLTYDLSMIFPTVIFTPFLRSVLLQVNKPF